MILHGIWLIVEAVEMNEGGNNGISTGRKGDRLFSRDKSKARICGRCLEPSNDNVRKTP